MKIVLTSDWHLGKNLYHQKLLSHQAKFFQETFLHLLKDVKPDLLIVAGDILDKPIPDQETIYFFEEFLKNLSTTKVKTLFILGNHDSRRTSLHKYFMEYADIHMVDDLRYLTNPLTLSGKRGEPINFYLLPYLPPYEILEKWSLSSSKNWESVYSLKEALNKIFINVKFLEPAILIGHFVLEEATFCGEELFLKGFSIDYTLSQKLFTPFRYVFLGHLHRYQVHKEKFIYPGAPLPYAFETFTEKRGVVLIEILGGAIIHQELIPLSPPYTLKYLRGSFQDIMALPREEAYVKIILEEDRPIFDAHAQLKTKFPNLLFLDYAKENYENQVISYTVQEELSENSKLDLRALFREFYNFVENEEPNGEIWRIFESYLEAFYKKEHREGELCH
ncbi:MAG: exonuclease SbcCD subunit D [Caldimicrobium sp.]|nr:exonuclease SbcCD subunit D [Caldimicrobium sp.]MCX7874383.1 exonuclease SbcCD subunit D [Caldimicrobium sp.]MDW8093509.1 exonuclease SbcCD subunit D [Caldimicrobium sp.]